MSSLVQAKCTNSSAGGQGGVFAQPFLEEVLDRLDVVVGGGLDRLDALRVGRSRSPRPGRAGARAAAGSNGATSVTPGSAASASSHSTSTRTRARIRPASLKIGRSGAQAPA